MKNKPKAWRESSRQNTIKGELTERQIDAHMRANPVPSRLLHALLDRAAGIA